MNITLIDFRNDPELRYRLELQARRERARMLGRVIGEALAHLFPKPGHAARPHLARQG